MKLEKLRQIYVKLLFSKHSEDATQKVENIKFLKNGFYNVVAGVVRIALGALTIPLLIRLLGVEEYGLWTLASAVIMMVSLAEAGLSTATTIFVSKDLVRENTEDLSQTLTVTLGAMLILATGAAITLWVGAESIVSLFPKLGQPQQLAVVQALKMGGLAVWARLLQQVLIGVEQAYQRYGLLNFLNTIQSVLFSLGLFSVAWLGGRTLALMQWQALASVAMLLSHAWVVVSVVNITHLRPTWNRERGLALARYSLMTWLTSLGSVLFLRGDRLIVGALLGSRTLGIYAAITDVTGMINSFSALPVQPLLPTLSGLMVKQDANQIDLKQKVKQAVEINALVALGLGAALFMLSPFVMHVVVKDSVNNENILAFRFATIFYTLYSLNAVGYYILFCLDRVKESMIIHLISGILSLILIAFASIFFGLRGAVLGNAGYLGTLSLIFVAMHHLYIAKKLWMGWFKFPLLWFVSIIILDSILNLNFTTIIVCIFLQTAILFKWFLNTQS